MALCTSTVQPVAPAEQSGLPVDSGVMASLLSLILLSVYAGQKSRKQLRRLKRRVTWLLIKQKIRSFFSYADVSDRQLLIYILLGIIILVLILFYPIAALVLAIIALILLLTGQI
jgi:hypothetical protein